MDPLSFVKNKELNEQKESAVVFLIYNLFYSLNLIKR